MAEVTLDYNAGFQSTVAGLKSLACGGAATAGPVTTAGPGGVTAEPLPSSGCGGTICGSSSSEPLTTEIAAYRESTSCTLDNSLVEAIVPGASANPQNVKTVEQIFPESKFNDFFPNKDAAYTYTNFLRAIGKYPAICKNAVNCPKILAGMFAHFQQETAGLFYLEEINKGAYCADWSAWVTAAFPCVSGQKYFGRGAKQLSWNYNYGAFSKAMFGDAKVLLENPGLVATTWLNFASSMWFYVTPQPPKPSMLQVVEGTWTPNAADNAANLKPGFGATTMIINGALECGSSPSNANGASNRANYYTDFAGRMGVDITGEKLTCHDSQPFADAGSAGGLALYWAPESGCSLVKWQTAYSALVEGDYNACKGIPADSCGTPTGGPVATAGPTTTAGSGGATQCASEDHDFGEVLRLSLLFYEAQRSGPLPADNRVPWRGDSSLGDKGNKGEDLKGGYHDAGDYVKFGYPMAGAMTILAYGGISYGPAYEAAGQMKYLKDAVKWGTDYIIKAHVSPNEFYCQVGNGDIDHAYPGRPETMGVSRPAYSLSPSKPGSDCAGESAAALAAASVLFADSDPAYAAELIQHAKQLFTFADTYRGIYSNSIADANKFYK